MILKKAFRAAKSWLAIGIGFNLVMIPIDLLLHRPILNGLWHDWLVADTTRRWQLLAVISLTLIAALLILTGIFAVGYGISAWLQRQDNVKN